MTPTIELVVRKKDIHFREKDKLTTYQQKNSIKISFEGKEWVEQGSNQQAIFRVDDKVWEPIDATSGIVEIPVDVCKEEYLGRIVYIGFRETRIENVEKENKDGTKTLVKETGIYNTTYFRLGVVEQGANPGDTKLSEPTEAPYDLAVRLAREWAIGPNKTEEKSSEKNNSLYWSNESKKAAENAAKSETIATEAVKKADEVINKVADIEDKVKRVETAAINTEASARNASSSATNAASSANSATTSATNAENSAGKAKTSETNAKTSETNAKTSETNASNSATVAEEAKKEAIFARDAISLMTVEAQTLETGKDATVNKTTIENVYHLTFGLPRGETGATGPQGATGNGIANIKLKSGTHAPGTSDIYTITMTDSSTFDFVIYNGTDGKGAGDMTAAVYDPNSKKTDIFSYYTAGTGIEITDGVINATAEVYKAGNGISIINGLISVLLGTGLKFDTDKKITLDETVFIKYTDEEITNLYNAVTI